MPELYAEMSCKAKTLAACVENPIGVRRILIPSQPKEETQMTQKAKHTRLAGAMAAAVVAGTAATADMDDAAVVPADTGLVVVFAQFETTLSFDEMVAKTTAQFPQWREMPGLVQTYYVKFEEPNRFGAIHIWKDKDALIAFRETEIAKTMGQYFALSGPPEMMVIQSVFQLRDTIVKD
jgi:hypothetical protein